VPARKKLGRPPRGKDGGVVKIRVTVAERKAWERAAGKLSLSEWIRERCNAAEAN
jgi:hypothetical protein